uniref:Putative secreted protein n=1 Tax=Rhipicephalus microplus TaxID=6941 RepID=A0A6M2DAZ3_RHIMP
MTRVASKLIGWFIFLLCSAGAFHAALKLHMSVATTFRVDDHCINFGNARSEGSRTKRLFLESWRVQIIPGDTNRSAVKYACTLSAEPMEKAGQRQEWREER